MPNCNINLVLKGKVNTIFNSDRELDAELLRQASSLKNWYLKSNKNLDKIFQTLSTKEETEQKLKDITNLYNTALKERGINKNVIKVKDDFEEAIGGDDDYAGGKISGTISMSNIVSLIGGKKDLSLAAITAINKGYEENFRTKKCIELGMADSEIYNPTITALWQHEKAKNNFSAKVGEDVHKIMELLFKQIEDPNIKIDDTVCKYLKGNVFNDSYSVLKKIADKIIKEHPNAKFYPEFSILSKTLDNNTQDVLKAANAPGVTQCSGRLDLLILNENGTVEVYDWKSSLKYVGDWAETNNKVCNEHGWQSSAKKSSNLLQIGGYAAILEQYGLTVGDKVLVNFKLDFDVAKDEKGEWHPTDIKAIKYDQPIIGSKGILQTSLANAKQRQMEYIFTSNKFIDTTALNPSNEMLKNLFPDTDLANTKVQQFKASIDYYKKKPNFIREITDTNSSSYKQGYRFYFVKDGIPNQTKNLVFCKNQEDIDKQIEKYVAEIEKFKSSEMTAFADNLQKVMDTKGLSDNALYGDWLSAFGEEQQQFLIHEFKKYYNNGWNFVKDEALNSNGIFLFNKNDQMDMIIIDSHPIRQQLMINGQTNICGIKLKDGEAGTDPYNLFKATYGNLLFMKGMSIIASNPKLLSNCKLNSMKVINPWHSTEYMSYSNTKLINNWNFLSRHNSEYKIPTVSPDWFFDDVSSYMNIVLELSNSLDNNIFMDKARPTAEDADYNNDTISEMMYEMRKNYKQTYNDPNTVEGAVYFNLSQALLASNGVTFTDEEDYGKYLNSGIIPSGTFITAADQSNSVSVRTMGKLMSRYRDLYTTEFTEIATKFSSLVSRVFKAWGFNPVTDSPTLFWKQFFDLGENGSPNQKGFKLKNPNSSFFTVGRTKEQTESAQDLINFIGDYMFEFKNSKMGPEQIEMAKLNGSYYEMPLQEANTGQFIRDQYNSNGIKGVLKGIIQNVRYRIKPAEEEIFRGGRAKQRQFEKEKSEYAGAFNRYTDISPREREALLLDPNRVWDTDIQSLFLETAAAACVTKASKKMIPQFLAYKSAVVWANSIGGAKTPELLEWMDKYIDNKVLRRKVMDESLDTVKDIINALKGITSFVTLGGNTRAFAREAIVDIYQSYTRAFTKQLPGITSSDFTEAIALVGRHKPLTLEGENIITDICRRMAMSSYSMTEMAESSKIKRYGIRQGFDKMAYWTSSLPDDYFRMAICVAKMLHDGCYDAYVEDESGVHYEIWKDKRFNKLFDSKGNIISNEDTDDIKSWTEQNELYKQYIEAWKIQGLDIDYGDTLPDCYSPEEKASLRTAASSLFGFFDTEDKSLLTATLLGSAFMQFKTFMSAKINQHAKSPGFENQWKTYVEKDKNGKEIWMIASTADEIAKGVDPIQYVTRDEVTDEDIANRSAKPVLITEGTYTKGMIQATGSILAQIANCKSQEEFNRILRDPINRGQLLNGLMDTLGLLIFAAIIKAVYGEDVVNNKSEQDWWTQWSYGVLMGFADDGPVNKVIGSVAGNIEPPAIGIVQQWANTAGSVLSGNRSIWNGIATTFGITREWSGTGILSKQA